MTYLIIWVNGSLEGLNTFKGNLEQAGLMGTKQQGITGFKENLRDVQGGKELALQFEGKPAALKKLRAAIDNHILIKPGELKPGLTGGMSFIKKNLPPDFIVNKSAIINFLANLR